VTRTLVLLPGLSSCQKNRKQAKFVEVRYRRSASRQARCQTQRLKRQRRLRAIGAQGNEKDGRQEQQQHCQNAHRRRERERER